MKTVISIAKCLLLIVLVVGFVVLGSKTVRNKLFYSSGLVPKEVFILNDKINSIPPEDTSEKRAELLKEIDAFAKGSVSGNGFSSKIYSLIKVRLDQALKEISQTQVPKGKVRIWFLYNMGIIAKSEDKTIAFDLAGTYAYLNLADFAKYIDVLVISHFHNDHFDLPVVKEALKNGVTVVVPSERVRSEGSQLLKDSNGEDILDYLQRHSGIKADNLIAIKPLEKNIIRGIEVTGYPSNHIYKPGPDEDPGIAPFPLDWYCVNLSGITLLHMGDGDSFDYQPDFTNKNIDVFITHNIDPRTNDNLIKLVPSAKTILPLHAWELQHGPDNINNMSYQNILDDYSNGYYKALPGKTRFIPLIWGESLSF